MPEILNQTQTASHKKAVVFCADRNVVRFAQFVANQIMLAEPERDYDICITTFDGALARLREATPVRRGRVMLVGPGEEGWETAMITVGEAFSVRRGENGVLFGVDSARRGVNDATHERYQFVESTLVSERIVGVGELQRVLTSGSSEDMERRLVWNNETRYSVVLMPEKRIMHVAFPDAFHAVGAYTTYSLAGGGR
ncbi:MAG: hypothetical protein L3J33_10535 [Rhodobacteraceae bacterium]|nr:hypothetical protein [Paracoccaceae bacterium]